MSNIGHGPLADHAAEPAEFARLIQHLERGDFKFMGCHADCWQGDRPCQAPDVCWQPAAPAPAEAATEVDSTPRPAFLRREGAGCFFWPAVTVGAGLIVIAVVHVIARLFN